MIHVQVHQILKYKTSLSDLPKPITFTIPPNSVIIYDHIQNLVEICQSSFFSAPRKLKRRKGLKTFCVLSQQCLAGAARLDNCWEHHGFRLYRNIKLGKCSLINQNVTDIKGEAAKTSLVSCFDDYKKRSSYLTICIQNPYRMKVQSMLDLTKKKLGLQPPVTGFYGLRKIQGKIPNDFTFCPLAIYSYQILVSKIF